MTDDHTERWASFHYVANYQGKGPRILVLVGPQWTAAMRAHYGITGKPFYERKALTIEPSTDASGHPWGWVSKPEEMMLEEHRWSSPETMQKLRHLLDGAMSPTPCEGIT